MLHILILVPSKKPTINEITYFTTPLIASEVICPKSKAIKYFFSLPRKKTITPMISMQSIKVPYDIIYLV